MTGFGNPRMWVTTLLSLFVGVVTGFCAVLGWGTRPMAEPAVPLARVAEVDVMSPERVPAPNLAFAPPGPDLVEVAAPRELRGMWVATVSNLDFPSRKGLSPTALRNELDHLVTRSRNLGFNALVFQVRPEGDALYASKLEPWSRFLTGRQGGDPHFDPLEHLVEAAHAHGIEVHAWFNPYRASSVRSAPVADNHISKWAKPYAHPWGALLWLDPGEPKVRDHAIAVIQDVVTRYDIDGVHLDDYFYPYPDGSRAFPDDATYRAYTSGGGKLGRAEWRRSNVDKMVEAVANLVSKLRPDSKFGISPFGIYRPGQPAGVHGLDQVAALNADPLLWYERGWIDYLAPQLYWTTTKEGQRYDKLLTWWNGKVALERPLIVGIDVTKVGSRDRQWTVDEIRSQVRLSREADHTAGQIWFRATPVIRNTAGLGDLTATLYASPALPPVTPRPASTPPAPPTLNVEGDEVRVSYDDRPALRGLVLYAAVGELFHTERILPPTTETFAVGPGVWALSAVTRGAHESRGVRFTIGGDGDLPGDAVSQP